MKERGLGEIFKDKVLRVSDKWKLIVFEEKNKFFKL